MQRDSHRRSHFGERAYKPSAVKDYEFEFSSVIHLYLCRGENEHPPLFDTCDLRVFHLYAFIFLRDGKLACRVGDSFVIREDRTAEYSVFA